MTDIGSAEIVPLELGTFEFPDDQLPGGHTPGHQSLAARTADGLVVLAGQACYTAKEWAGETTPLEGRSGAPDVDAYDRSIQRLRDLRSTRVRFGHDRAAWTA